MMLSEFHKLKENSIIKCIDKSYMLRFGFKENKCYILKKDISTSMLITSSKFSLLIKHEDIGPFGYTLTRKDAKYFSVISYHSLLDFL